MREKRDVYERGCSVRRLEQRAKLISGETGIADEATHRVGVHRIVPRNGQDAGTVGHDDVLSLAEHPKPSLWRARTAAWWLTPATFGTFRTLRRSHER